MRSKKLYPSSSIDVPGAIVFILFDKLRVVPEAEKALIC